MPEHATLLELQATDTRNESILTEYIISVEGDGFSHELQPICGEEWAVAERAYAMVAETYDKGEDGVSAHVQLLARDYFKGWVDPTDTILKTNT